MLGERLLNRDRRRRGKQIEAATRKLQTENQGSELSSTVQDVIKPRFVLTESIPAPSFDTKWQSYAKAAGVVAGIGAAAIVAGKVAYTDKDTGEFDMGKAGRSLGKVLAVGGAEGVSGVAGITVRHHRELTHKSLKLSEFIQKWVDAEQRSLGVAEPYTWAAVHRIHHAMEDTSLFPFYRLHHAMQEAEARGLEVPQKFGHLDPFVKEFDRETVAELGAAADTMVRDRLSDPRLGEKQYKKPSFDETNDEELLQILNPSEPQYAYPEYVKKTTAEEFTQDDIAQVLLTDPHSPALLSVQGVAMNGVNLYQSSANMFRAIPLLKPEDLQRPGDELPPEERVVKKSRAVAAGFGINAGLMFLANRDFSAQGAVRAALEGSAVNGVRGGMEIAGGNITNSAGHMGDPVQTELAQAFLNKRYKIHLKEDGTVSTNTVGKGVIGRAASWATLDEVGGQEIHHRSPEKIKYTDKEGVQAVIEAPWGSFLEFLAKNERLKFIQEGDGFDGQREDVVNDAVKIIQAERAKQYAKDLQKTEQVVFSS